MIITFCGHAEIYNGQEELHGKVLSAIMEHATGEEVVFYLGGYGDFDWIALRCCKEYKQTHPDAKLIFVSPYLDEVYFKRRERYIKECDGIEVAEVESTPKRFAILKRNEWMVKHSDFLIAYVKYSWGGAAKMLKYAVSHKKPLVNIAKMP
ncbi:MAG TPA: hypothetical protein DIC18_02195 [Clostridiales bacterium]|nr:hypothetical protein [Clostridiales bacterium]